MSAAGSTSNQSQTLPEGEEQRPLLQHRTSPGHVGDLDGEGGVTGEVAGIAEEPSTARVAIIMCSMWTSTFFAALDSTIVANLASPISASLHSSTLLSWIASGYLIANAAFQPLSGKLSDIFGRKTGVIVSTTFFALGTLICGVAQNATTIILGRVVAGAGGGCINTMSVFIASDLIPLRRRGLWQGFSNLVYGVGMGLGGVYGGLLNDHFGWRWAFYAQVPFIVLAGILGWVFIDIPAKEVATRRIERVDFLGALTLATSLVLLLLGLNSGGNLVPWRHSLIYVSLPLSGVALAAFFFIEKRVAREPIIPMHFLLNRTVLSACLTNWFNAMAVYALLYYIPIYLQSVDELSITGSGARLIPQSIGTSVGSLATGFTMRATGRYWWLGTVAQSTYIASSILIVMTLNASGTSTWTTFAYLFISGVAHGAMQTVTLSALLSSVQQKDQAVTTSASYAFRGTGSSIGITVASAIFQNQFKHALWDRFGDQPGASVVIHRIRGNLGDITFLSPEWREGVRQAYAESLTGVWAMVVGLNVLAFAVSLFTRENELHNKLDRGR